MTGWAMWKVRTGCLMEVFFNLENSKVARAFRACCSAASRWESSRRYWSCCRSHRKGNLLSKLLLGQCCLLTKCPLQAGVATVELSTVQSWSCQGHHLSRRKVRWRAVDSVGSFLEVLHRPLHNSMCPTFIVRRWHHSDTNVRTEFHHFLGEEGVGIVRYQDPSAWACPWSIVSEGLEAHHQQSPHRSCCRGRSPRSQSRGSEWPCPSSPWTSPWGQFQGPPTRWCRFQDAPMVEAKDVWT